MHDTHSHGRNLSSVYSESDLVVHRAHGGGMRLLCIIFDGMTVGIPPSHPETKSPRPCAPATASASSAVTALCAIGIAPVGGSGGGGGGRSRGGRLFSEDSSVSKSFAA